MHPLLKIAYLSVLIFNDGSERAVSVGLSMDECSRWSASLVEAFADEHVQSYRCLRIYYRTEDDIIQHYRSINGR